MSRGFARKPIALAAVAAAAAAVAVVTEQKLVAPAPPAVVIAPGGTWQAATVALIPDTTPVQGCGQAVALTEPVVTHPALPCGTRIVVANGKRQAAVQVAGRTPLGPGATLGIQPATAKVLRLAPGATVRWALRR